jgi:hypothetical protein
MAWPLRGDSSGCHLRPIDDGAVTLEYQPPAHLDDGGPPLARIRLVPARVEPRVGSEHFHLIADPVALAAGVDGPDQCRLHRVVVHRAGLGARAPCIERFADLAHQDRQAVRRDGPEGHPVAEQGGGRGLAAEMLADQVVAGRLAGGVAGEFIADRGDPPSRQIVARLPQVVLIGDLLILILASRRLVLMGLGLGGLRLLTGLGEDRLREPREWRAPARGSWESSLAPPHPDRRRIGAGGPARRSA